MAPRAMVLPKNRPLTILPGSLMSRTNTETEAHIIAHMTNLAETHVGNRPDKDCCSIEVFIPLDKVFRLLGSLAIRNLCLQVANAVESFEEETQQSDDVTVIAVKFHGS